MASLSHGTLVRRFARKAMCCPSVTVGSDDFEPASSEGAGAGGVRRFTFHVKSPGKTTLRLAYGRSWETDKDAARRFELTVAATS